MSVGSMPSPTVGATELPQLRYVVNEPSDLPNRDSGNDAARISAQLSLLLSATFAMVEEEFKRSERLDSKSRNQLSVAAGFFAVGQTTVVQLLNGRLGEAAKVETGPWFPWVLGAAVVALAALMVAVTVSYRAWRLRPSTALKTKTIEECIEPARVGNPAAAVALVNGNKRVIDVRRDANKARARAAVRAAYACFATMGLVIVELALAIVAIR